MADNTNIPRHARSAMEQDAYIPAPTSAYSEYKKYTRDSWQQGHALQIPKKKKMGVGKKVALACLAVVLLVGSGLGAYIWQLNSALSIEGNGQGELLSQLVEKKADEPFYILVLGSDKRELSDSAERSDVTMLVRVDTKNKIVTMLTIPRDTPVTFEDGHSDRVNAAYRSGGAAEAVKVVSSFTGLPISHYAEIRISEFENLIDDLGGIDIEVLAELHVKDVLTGEWVTIEPGWQHINGQQAQIVARSRKDYSDGDISRQGMNRQIIMAIVQNILSRPTQEIPGTVLQVASHVDTDMTTFDFLSLLMEMGTDYDAITFYSATGPTDGGNRSEYGDRWICYDNPEGWRLIIEALDAGEDPSAINVDEYTIYPEE